jgi:hypothetical protein
LKRQPKRFLNASIFDMGARKSAAAFDRIAYYVNI